VTHAADTPGTTRPEHHPPGTTPATAGDANEFLCHLRREFPRWGILRGTSRGPWVAVRSSRLGRLEITAKNGIALREKLLAIAERDGPTRPGRHDERL
jgi:hypothetical protein